MKTVTLYRGHTPRQKQLVGTVNHPEALEELAAVLRKWGLLPDEPDTAFPTGSDALPDTRPQKPEVVH